jgi:GMP synthase (glutamine-hydrolysing)
VLPITILQHEADTPPCVIGYALEELDIPFEVRHLYLGDELPRFPEETSGLIVLGGSMHVTQKKKYRFLEGEIRYLRSLLKLCAPVWGVCLGAQLLTVAAGGDVFRRDRAEIGWVSIEKLRDDALLQGIGSPFVAFEWHLYSCKLPPFSEAVAEGEGGLQVFRAGGRAWGTQFHPEVDGPMVESWILEQEKELEKKRPGLAARMREDTETYLAANDTFCRRLTRNFLLASDLL